MIFCSAGGDEKGYSYLVTNVELQDRGSSLVDVSVYPCCTCIYKERKSFDLLSFGNIISDINYFNKGFVLL